MRNIPCLRIKRLQRTVRRHFPCKVLVAHAANVSSVLTLSASQKHLQMQPLQKKKFILVWHVYISAQQMRAREPDTSQTSQGWGRNRCWFSIFPNIHFIEHQGKWKSQTPKCLTQQKYNFRKRNSIFQFSIFIPSVGKIELIGVTQTYLRWLAAVYCRVV